MSQLDEKINQHFAGKVVRKDLVKAVKGNAIVPSYVLEYLLGQYCATNDEATIQSGIETVREILRKHYVHRNEAGLIKSNIREKGRYKVIDKISVSLNDKNDVYEAEFSSLGIKKVLVASDTVKAHPKLLVSGVWCIADLEYEHSEDKNACPWVMSALKPIQLSHLSSDEYLKARKEFTTEEWVDLLIQSMGFNPEMFGKRNKLLQLVRMIPFCERNYNLIELGPKGTGKSHIYSEFSPHGILISGGEVSVPKLFVSNASGKIGLVGYWDTVAFDEFAGQEKKVDKALVDIMKNYMANKSFSRGVETLGAEASMAFVGNTQHTVPYMLKHTDLFDALPAKFHDSAFLDRLHFYIPGWEVDIIRGEMFSAGYGFVVDYLAEVLRSMRNHDLSDRYQAHYTLSSDISTRDRDSIHKTFSGLMKIIYPTGEATKEELGELLAFAMEGRKRVKDQLFRIDRTYAAVDFAFSDAAGNKRQITTLEEREYPAFYNKGIEEADDGVSAATPKNPEREAAQNQPIAPSATMNQESAAAEGHHSYEENQKGVSYDKLFGPYLKGATHIKITDPYIRMFYQLRNLMELLETIARYKEPGEEVQLELLTGADEIKPEEQLENLQRIQESAQSVGIEFSWTLDNSNTLHDRFITTDDGWKIVLGRGLDIYQHYPMNDAFALANRLQEHRSCKAFAVTYVKER